MKNAKGLIFSLIFIAIGFAFLAVLELSFRLFGFGYSTDPFMVSAFDDNVYIDNPKYVYKYYSNTSKLEPQPISNIFPVKKAEKTLRGFVIGESTAQGFPFYPNHSFSQILEQGLVQSGKYAHVEIINLGQSAMSSYYVKDAAFKAMAYQPDFVVIYSGHNEYYGTITRNTGGSQIANNLYLFLKEFRLFQVFYDLLNQGKSQDDKTLMAQQFDGKKVSPESVDEPKAISDYLANIEEVIRAYKQIGVPVFLVEPVSNLVNMPPFSGSIQTEDKKEITDYEKAIASANHDQLAAVYEAKKAVTNNANIQYLNAIADSVVNHTINLDMFKRAKDLDCIPFRMRTSFIQALRKFAGTKSVAYDNLAYVNLEDAILHTLGVQAFGRELFIDHLHFNFLGNRFLAYTLAQSIGKKFKFSDDQQKMVNDFLNNQDKVRDSISLPAPQELFYYTRINLLANQPPFNQMLIPFEPTPFELFFKGKDFFDDKTFFDNLLPMLQKGEIANYYSALNAYYYARKDGKALDDFFKMFIQITPTNPEAYLSLADFYLESLHDDKDAIKFYVAAYKFANGNPTVIHKVKDVFAKLNLSSQFDQLEKKYGKSKE